MEFWTTQDGRVVQLSEMDDLHLLHAMWMCRRNALEHKAASLQGEAQRRGLDVTTPPTRTVSAFAWLMGELADVLTVTPEEAAARAAALCELHGLDEPTVDLHVGTHAPTYQHWRKGGRRLPGEGRMK